MATTVQVKGLRQAMTGNDAAAEALRQVNPDVAAVYPITPQTELMHKFAEFVANGAVDTNLVLVESEHSAMSASIGAASTGARTITATSACGLAYMWELLYVAAGCRIPLVMPVVNRALSANINIHCDHSDTMGARDAGWIHIFSENSQQAYDNILQAFRIAEDPATMLPIMVTFDGFIISHTMETLELLPDEAAKSFVGAYKAQRSLLDLDHPMTIGPLDLQNYYFEHKRQQVAAMDNARETILNVGRAYGELTGRSYGYYEPYKLDDADVVIVVLGSTAGTAKDAADIARDEGIKAGVLSIRCFRPFPGKELAAALSKASAIGVMDRSISFGLEGGPVFHELRSYAGSAAAKMSSYVYGLGGRDITTPQVLDIFHTLAKSARGTKGELFNFVGLRE